MTLIKNSEEQIAIVEINGRPNIIEIQGQLVDAVNFIHDEKLQFAILDTTKMEGMFILSLYWYRMQWLPLAKESGLKHLAVILPEAFAPEKRLNRLNNAGDKLRDIQIMFFNTPEAGKDWIASLE